MKLKLAVLSLAFFIPLLGFSQSKAMDYHLIIGTYTKTQNNGLFVYKFNTETGKLSFESKTEGVVNPSYLAINNDATKVYSVSEAEGKQSGVSAFNFDAKNGVLSFINSQPTTSPGPCHVTLSKDGKFAFSANYGGGSLSVFPIKGDGSLAPVSQLIKHAGNSIDKKRQNEPHVHSTTFSPDGSILYVADLGTDFVNAYKYNGNEKQPLTSEKSSDIKVALGFGPRHFTFNKKGDKLYVMNEMKPYVSVFDYKNNKATLLQEINSNATDFKGEDGGADIHLSNDGKFLYTTNRGTANNIGIFKIEKNGKLTKVGNESTKGKGPRNFAIDPTDNFLLVGHQYTDDIFVFRRDQKTGLLSFTGEKINVGSPVCLKFVEVKN
ncbi:lactonase family protein [Pedobacter arcticus]|uniref:lactonase family protein n=1 Tax=Pedobacter arcticus TaxID=752140 RepID=UPI0003000ABB|nr:lactonase family protein [Pedobacter arcticus]